MAYRPEAHHLIILVNELIRCHCDTHAKQAEQDCQASRPWAYVGSELDKIIQVHVGTENVSTFFFISISCLVTYHVKSVTGCISSTSCVLLTHSGVG